jgi:multiple sugar transport system substrate-binding protein
MLSLVACGGSKGTAGGKQKVNFWYLWGGDEAKTLESIIAAYNASQSKYEVVGLSTPDQQKIITAISGGQGPDIADDFGGSVPKYATENIAMALDDYIAKDKVDTSVFVDAALKHQQFQGKTYSLPLSVNVYALYYNKDLLKAAGITKLPESLEELESMSEKTTKVKGAVMTQLGGPFVTASYWPYCYTYAYGDTFGSADATTLTPDNPGFRKVLEYTASQVKKFGKDPLNNFITSGRASAYTPQDPFCQGTQVFRIDGPWFYKMAQDAKVNFDIMPLPGAASKGGQGYSVLDTSMLFIPTTAKAKDGAWDFLKYMTMGEGSRLYVTKKGDLPPTKTLAADPEIAKLTPFNKTYLDIVAQGNFHALPQFGSTSIYDKNIEGAVTDVLLGASVDKALADLKAKTDSNVLAK